MSSAKLSTGHRSTAPLRTDVDRCLSYNPDNGLFYWKVNRPPLRKKGDRAGYVHKTGYVRIGLCGQSYQAHRLAWLIYYQEWPPDIVDHINGDKSDNRIKNLRLANVQQNGRNRKTNRNNNTGYRGVSQSGERWHATITVDRKTQRLGSFDSLDKALAARREAEKQHFGRFNRLS